MPESRSTRSGRRAATTLVVLFTLIIASVAYVMMPVDDEVGDVDAVISLGGGAVRRVELALQIADENDAALVLSSDAGIWSGGRAGVTCDMADVICTHPEPETTAGEARRMHELAREYDWDRIAVATESFHTNRSRMLFRQCFGDDVDVVGISTSASLGDEVYRWSREFGGRVAGATIRRAC